MGKKIDKDIRDEFIKGNRNGGKLSKDVNQTIRAFERGDLTPEQFQKVVNEYGAQLQTIDPTNVKQISQINRLLDYASSGKAGPGGDTTPGTTTPDDQSSYVPEPGAGGTQTLDEYLSGGLDASQFTKNLNENQIMAAALEHAVQGQKFAYEEYAGAEDAFMSDPLVQQLNQSSLDLLENPDVINDSMLQEMLAGSESILSRSYQGQQANLAGQIGGLNMDPNDPLAQSLAAENRFGALQAQAQNRTSLQTNAALMNRQALEDAMRLGLGTSGYIQGTQNQFTANKANILMGQPLAGIGPEAAALQAAMNFDSGGNDMMSLFSSMLNRGGQGAQIGTAVYPGWGTLAGAVLGVGAGAAENKYA